MVCNIAFIVFYTLRQIPEIIFFLKKVCVFRAHFLGEQGIEMARDVS